MNHEKVRWRNDNRCGSFFSRGTECKSTPYWGHERSHTRAGTHSRIAKKTTKETECGTPKTARSTPIWKFAFRSAVVCATLSIAICISALALYLLLTETMTEWLRHRWRKAEINQQWWLEKYQHRASTRWPFTDWIERLAQWLRYMTTWPPVVAGLFFLMSLT